jgi:hypothetical protein
MTGGNGSIDADKHRLGTWIGNHETHQIHESAGLDSRQNDFLGRMIFGGCARFEPRMVADGH